MNQKKICVVLGISLLITSSFLQASCRKREKTKHPLTEIITETSPGRINIRDDADFFYREKFSAGTKITYVNRSAVVESDETQRGERTILVVEPKNTACNFVLRNKVTELKRIQDRQISRTSWTQDTGLGAICTMSLCFGGVMTCALLAASLDQRTAGEPSVPVGWAPGF